MSNSEIVYYSVLLSSAVVAIIGAVIWLDYYRKIDVFEKEKFSDLIIALVIGGTTVLICDFIYKILGHFHFNTNGHLIHDFLYSVLGIGLNEEFSKIVGVVVVLNLLKKKINEPIDYLIYGGVTALGFSVVENYDYFNYYGPQIAPTRIMISSLVHMINTCIIVYSYMRFYVFGIGKPWLNMFLGSSAAIMSHGLFDLFLTENYLGPATSLLSTIIYLIGINFWVQMLNNALNFSSHFEFEKIHHSQRLFYRLLYWFLLTILFSFISRVVFKSTLSAFFHLFWDFFTDGFMLLMVILRVSRFKFYPKKYFDIKIQLPFYITRNDDEDFMILSMIPIKVRGENIHESEIARYINKEITIVPVTSRKTFIGKPRKAMIINKFFLEGDVVTYLMKIIDEKTGHELFYLIKPKTRGITIIDEKYPIVGLIEYHNPVQFNQTHEHLYYKNLRLIEWVYIK